MFFSDVAGSEMIIAQTNTIAHIDRPVTVDANALEIKTKNSLLFLAASNAGRFLYLYDDNILADNAGNVLAYFPQPISFALHNAVFKTTKTNGCLLFGELAENFINVEKGNLILSFGIYAYLPILPDPYVANLGVLKEQFIYYSRIAGVGDAYSSRYNQQVWLLLISTIKWSKQTTELDDVDVAFSFAPLPQQQAQTYAVVAFDRRSGQMFQERQTDNANIFASDKPIANNSFIQNFNAGESNSIADSSNQNLSGKSFQTEMLIIQQGLPDYQSEWNERYNRFQQDMFALLDVSSRANQMGVSYQPLFFREGNIRGDEQLEMYKTYDVAAATH